MPLPDLTNIVCLNRERVVELVEQAPHDKTLFSRLNTIFEAEGPELIAELEKLLPEGNRSEIHDTIHKMKGSSAAMGASRIYLLASVAVDMCDDDESLDDLFALPAILEKEYASYGEEAKQFLD